jgi:hypothetical protein
MKIIYCLKVLNLLIAQKMHVSLLIFAKFFPLKCHSNGLGLLFILSFSLLAPQNAIFACEKPSKKEGEFS